MKNNVSCGFSLVEMAVVLVIFGLLLGGLALPLTAQLDQRNYSETRQQVADIKEALIGYGLTHGYLPCPAISFSNGAEDRSGTGSCNKRVGFLPWAELGVPKLDSWGHLFGYSVTFAYANSANKIALSPLTTRDITLETRDDSGALTNLSNSNDIPAVIISYGKNAAWATSNDGTFVNDTATNQNDDEDTNGTSAGQVYISREISENENVSYGEFDDIVAWISPSIYINRMVAAGQLP